MRVLPPATDGPLLPWLLAALAPTSRTRVKQLLRYGQVSVNGVPTTQFDYPLKAGDRVTIATDRPVSAGIHIVFQDDDLIIIDKPAGVLSVATEGEKADTTFARLNADLAARREGRPFVVHRLDRETSGLLLFARSATIRDKLQTTWDRVRKTYLAVVEGEPSPREGVIRNFLIEGKNLRVRASDGQRPGAKEAITRYRVVKARTAGRWLRWTWRRGGSTRSASTWPGSAARLSATRGMGRRPTRPGGWAYTPGG